MKNYQKNKRKKYVHKCPLDFNRPFGVLNRYKVEKRTAREENEKEFQYLQQKTTL